MTYEIFEVHADCRCDKYCGWVAEVKMDDGRIGTAGMATVNDYEVISEVLERLMPDGEAKP